MSWRDYINLPPDCNYLEYEEVVDRPPAAYKEIHVIFYQLPSGAIAETFVWLEPLQKIEIDELELETIGCIGVVQ